MWCSTTVMLKSHFLILYITSIYAKKGICCYKIILVPESQVYTVVSTSLTKTSFLGNVKKSNTQMLQTLAPL